MPTLEGIIVIVLLDTKRTDRDDPTNSHSQNPGATHQTRVSEGAETT